MDKIKLRQICFLFAAMLPVTKMLVYPAALSYTAKNDLLLSALVNIAAEGLVLLCVMLLAKHTDRTFFGLLQDAFGTITARILYGAFALFFAFSALLPLLEQKNFVMQILYENAPSLLSFAPFFAVCFFACVKGLKSIGRAADLALPVFAVSFIALLFLSVTHADFAALLPVGGAGAKSILQGSLYSLTWYTDCLLPLFFLGHFEYRKGGTWKVMLSYAVGAFAVLLFLAAFYGVFADIAPQKQNAIAQIAKYTTAFMSLGRIDLFFVFALTLVMVLYLCVPVQLSVHCVRKIFGNCDPLIPAAAVNLLLFALTIFFNYSFHELQLFFAQRLWFVFILFCYAVPALALLLPRLRRGDKNKKPSENGKKSNDTGERHE